VDSAAAQGSRACRRGRGGRACARGAGRGRRARRRAWALREHRGRTRREQEGGVRGGVRGGVGEVRAVESEFLRTEIKKTELI